MRQFMASATAAEGTVTDIGRLTRGDPSSTQTVDLTVVTLAFVN